MFDIGILVSRRAFVGSKLVKCFLAPTLLVETRTLSTSRKVYKIVSM